MAVRAAVMPRSAAVSGPQGFAAVREASHAAEAFELAHTPCVLRGIGAAWPAVQQWSFPQLAALAPSLRVQLVVGNRERHKTRFTTSTLGDYLNGLHTQVASDVEPTYLKEFDLLATFPHLRGDLRPHELFPRDAIVSSSTWIGPAQAHTGLHCDRLDNIAMLIAGRKRFYLAAPGTVESLGEVSDKHDRWATLSRIDVHELASRGAGPLHAVDLMPGDALYVPAGWWHEVINLDASILLSGFFGSKPRVIGQWLYTGAVQGLHLAGVWRKGNCACHA